MGLIHVIDIISSKSSDLPPGQSLQLVPGCVVQYLAAFSSSSNIMSSTTTTSSICFAIPRVDVLASLEHLMVLT
eukprot:8172767-Prorocentrum_lima.AAC.1